MLDSAQLVLNHYIDEVSRYKIYSIQMERGENPDDLYYLCNIDDKHYVVFETDYVGPLHAVLNEAMEIFSRDFSPICWLVKKSHHEEAGESRIPVQTPKDIELLRTALVSKRDDSYLRYVVMEFKSHATQPRRYNPNAYGKFS